MKRIVSILLSLLLVFMLTTASAETVISVSRGATVNLKVYLEDASGYYARIGIKTNSAPITFVKATGGAVNDTVPPQSFSGFFEVVNGEGVTIAPDGTVISGDPSKVSELEDGHVGTLTFKVKDNAAYNKTYTIETYLKSGSATVDGTIKIKVVDRIPGDANDDGTVTTDDAVAIMKWIAGFPGVVINEANANCNGDNVVSTDDAVAIMKWIAGFPGVVLQ